MLATETGLDLLGLVTELGLDLEVSFFPGGGRGGGAVCDPGIPRGAPLLWL